MNDINASITSLEARARRRRMHRHFRKRRLTRIVVSSISVLALAVVLPPKPTLHPVSAVIATSLRTKTVATLPIEPSWRPAADVLKRKSVAALPSLPFGLDEKDAERKESLNRWHRIYTYSVRYHVKPELARQVYDAAVTAGIEPELGFRLVRVESVFDPRAQSRAGAMGLTQLMLGTAREYEPNVSREQLLDPDINLRIGFKYLRGLIRDYKGDLRIALLVYNRGPAAVHSALSMGNDPANGYESMVMKGYRGRGTLD